MRSSPAVVWAGETRGREEERRSANVRCRRTIAGKPGTLSSFFAPYMSTEMTGNDAYNFRVITPTFTVLPFPSKVLPPAPAARFHSGP